MPETANQEPTNKPQAKKKSLWLTVTAIACIVGYVLFQPTLERTLGIDLPNIIDRPATTDGKQTAPTAGKVVKNPTPKKVLSQSQRGQPRQPVVVTKPEPAKKSPKNISKQPVQSTPSKPKPGTVASKTKPALGQLKKIARAEWISAAGLKYGPGSKEGHRVTHIMLHEKDQPNRPGSHGVFDGTRDEIFALIDEAYLIAKKRGPPQAKIKKERGRTIYTVHLRRRIGYLGGQTGKQKNHPPLYHLRLVLEGVNVITAFPLKP